jgi:hypothetical protein
MVLEGGWMKGERRRATVKDEGCKRNKDEDGDEDDSNE